MLDAGRIALEHFTEPQTEHKPDNSLVTVADHAVEEFLTQKLVRDEPQDRTVTLVGEETVGVADEETIHATLNGVTWVVDPIDGTASYANKLPTWGVSLGRLEDGRFTDGALFLPRTGDLFITDGSDVLYEENPRDPGRWRFEALKALNIPERPYNPMGMLSFPHEIAYGGRYTGSNPFQANGSAVYSMAQLILGGYLAYVARIKLWDVAGSIPLLQRLGFLVQYPDGHLLGDSVTERDWVLEPGNHRIWRSRGTWMIARNRDTLEHLRDHYHSAGEEW